MQKQITLVKPTVVFLGYGMASSFENQPEQFGQDMRALKAAVRKAAGGPIRFVVLSPLRHEQLGGSLPDPAVHNRSSLRTPRNFKRWRRQMAISL